jgi:hypothetical protein
MTLTTAAHLHKGCADLKLGQMQGAEEGRGVLLLPFDLPKDLAVT